MKYFYILLAIIFFLLFVVFDITNYKGRIKEYNYHMCVEVYGLDENCQEKLIAPIPDEDIVEGVK